MYMPNSEFQKEKKIINTQCAKIWLRTNDKYSPLEFADAIQKEYGRCLAEGWKDIKISSDEWGDYSPYITLNGKREETDEEYENRMNWIKQHWKNQRNDYLKKKEMWESEYGQNILKECNLG